MKSPIASGAADFATRIRKLIENPALRRAMGESARKHACLNAWDGVFDHLYAAYMKRRFIRPFSET